MAALDLAVSAGSHPHQHVTTKTLDQRHPFARLCGSQRPQRIGDRSGWELLAKLIDQRHALLDLADTNPDASVDIPFLAHGRFELQRIVRWIARSASRVEASPRGAADIAAATVLAREPRRQNPRADGAVLQR